jgi:hypothetical protein
MTHKTKLKCLINPVLRKLQWFTDKPYVIVSKFKTNLFIGYTFKRIKYSK